MCIEELSAAVPASERRRQMIDREFLTGVLRRATNDEALWKLVDAAEGILGLRRGRRRNADLNRILERMERAGCTRNERAKVASRETVPR